jgi:putative endonuclease
MDPTDAHDRARLGAAAETMAAAYLTLCGWVVAGRNVRICGGEIDVVARRGDWLLLVEVRYRRETRFGQPIETICGRKARALARAARAYIARHRGNAGCWRLDVVTVTLATDGSARIRQYPGAVPL